MSDQAIQDGGARPLPFDRAWGVLLGACLCMFSGIPSVIYYTTGLFLPDISASTRWPAAAIAGAIGPGALIVALAAPFVGRLSDRFGARPLALIGGPAFALGLAALGLAPQTVGVFIALTVVMYLLAFAGSPLIYAHALTGWFDRRRGMALGLMFASGALGIAVWPPFAALLIEALGWRYAYVVLGVTAGAIIFLSGLLLLKSPPARREADSVEGSATRTAANAAGMTSIQALKTPRFWKIAAVFTLMSAVLGGTAVQLPLILRQSGADAQTAAAIMSVVGVSMLVGRLLLGVCLDRWFAPWITIGIALLSMAAFALLLFGSGPAVLVVVAALIGFGLGSEYAEVSYIVSRAFGLRAFGAIYGLVTLATGIGLAAGPALIGVGLVSGVDRRLIFYPALGVLALSIVVLLTIRRDELPYGGSPAR